MPLPWLQVLQIGASILDSSSKASAGRDQARAYEAEARAEEAATAFNFETFHKQSSAQLARARALRGGSGVEVGTGSSLAVDEATISEIMRQESRIHEEGKLRAEALRAGGKAAKRAGNIGGFTSLLEGGAQLLDLF